VRARKDCDDIRISKSNILDFMRNPTLQGSASGMAANAPISGTRLHFRQKGGAKAVAFAERAR